jgi:hypothetical protein
MLLWSTFWKYTTKEKTLFDFQKNTAVLTDYRIICTGLASFMIKSFTNTNRKVKNAQPQQYKHF